MILKLIIGGVVLVLFLIVVLVLSLGLILSREKPDPAAVEAQKQERSLADKIKEKYALDEDPFAKTVYTANGDLATIEKKTKTAEDERSSFTFNDTDDNIDINLEANDDADNEGYTDFFKSDSSK